MSLGKEFADVQFLVTVDGREHRLRIGDLSGADIKEFRAATGRGVTEVMLMGEGVDLDVLAGLLWLARRKNGERRLAYEQVAAELSWGSLDDFDVKESDPSPPTRPTSTPDGL